ncbi:MAG TPA: response regulator [Terriglobales bacterium]|nr:response regulator [Terriglobales bacterium]
MSPASSPGPAPLPILVVEDEPAVMEFMRAALERSGYATVAASSGAEALRLLAGGQYLGVITDMRTPGGVSGADVHAWIEAHRRDLAARVIFVTGDTVNENTAAVLQHTGAPFVEKPFRVQQLIGMVEKVFGKPQ